MDVDAEKLQGELMDLQHGSAFIKNAKIQASTGNCTIQFLFTGQLVELHFAHEANQIIDTYRLCGQRQF